MTPGRRGARALVALAAALAALPARAATCPANRHGDPMDWAIAVCYGKVETDDPAHPEVSACLGQLIEADRIGQSDVDNCALNRKYRRVWCAQLVHSGVEASLAACLRSPRMPPQVADPGGR